MEDISEDEILTQRKINHQRANSVAMVEISPEITDENKSTTKKNESKESGKPKVTTITLTLRESPESGGQIERKVQIPGNIDLISVTVNNGSENKNPNIERNLRKTVKPDEFENDIVAAK